MTRSSGREVTRMPDVEIYTQPWCPYCARALHILSGKGVAFREIEAPSGTPERAEATRRSGGRTTVPQIFIGGEHIGGCDDLVALDRAGKLDKLLHPA
jgi:glutaredoxin 3